MMTARLRPAWAGKDRGSVTLMTALLAPVLAMAVGLGVEVSNWAVTQIRVQRTADVAAVAGMISYNKTGNVQTSATTAAKLAEVNGASGTATPTWSSGSQTLTDNNVTVQVTNGVRNSANKAMQVTVRQPVALSIAKIFSSISSVTVTANGYAELIPSSGSSVQPCMLALAGSNVGIATGTDITFTGDITINTPNCSVRSDAGVSIGGNTSITTAGLYAGGSITINGNSATVSGPKYQNAGQVPDPYANNATLQAALSNANSATGTAITCQTSGCTGPAGSFNCTSSGCTIQPGTYTGMKLTGSTTYTLAPGLYTINGNISWGGSNTVVAGSDITIVLGAGSGSSPYTFDTSGSTVMQLNAANSTNASSVGAIPGIMFATQSAGTMKLTGNSGMPFTGVVYAPNANIRFSGTSSLGTSGCAEVIGSTINVTGTAGLTATGCSTYGTTVFASMPTTYTATLVR